MNYLAHAWLAGDAPADRLGGLIGDFVKGALPAGLPADVAAGVRLHRSIDAFADSDPAFRRSRARISTQRRRFAGVMVDMFYDHFLARHWARYHDVALETFSGQMYGLMEENEALLPPRFTAVLPHMRDGDWLTSYRSADTVAFALERIAARLSRAELFAGAGEELFADYAGFEADFFEFIESARRFATMHRAARGFGTLNATE